jgi:hypothetical protein
LVREGGSEIGLPRGATRDENRPKRPTLEQGGMFMIIWKSYIWMLGDIPEKPNYHRI